MARLQQQYREKVVPEYLIVVSQPVLTDDEVARYGLPGFGGASAGYHVVMLNDFGGKWWVVSTAGRKVTSAPAAPASNSSSGGGYGY